jgi:hypothetical protein
VPCRQAFATANNDSEADAHAELLAVLQNGLVDSVDAKTVSQFNHESYVLRLRSPSTGRIVKVLPTSLYHCLYFFVKPC